MTTNLNETERAYLLRAFESALKTTEIELNDAKAELEELGSVRSRKGLEAKHRINELGRLLQNLSNVREGIYTRSFDIGTIISYVWDTRFDFEDLVLNLIPDPFDPINPWS